MRLKSTCFDTKLFPFKPRINWTTTDACYLFKHVQWQLGWYGPVLKCKTQKIQMYKFLIIINCTKKLTLYCKRSKSLSNIYGAPGGTQQSFIWGGSMPRFNPSPSYVSLNWELLFSKWHPFLISISKHCIPFKCIIFIIWISQWVATILCLWVTTMKCTYWSLTSF